MQRHATDSIAPDSAEPQLQAKRQGDAASTRAERATAKRFRGVRALVTGGTSGLGLALVEALVQQGAKVVFVARTADSVRRVAAQTGAHGIASDVSKKADTHRIALRALAALGGIDLVVHAASTLGHTPLRLLAETDCEVLGQTLETNVVGPFRLNKALLGGLSASAREGRGAVVVHVTSDAGVESYPRWGAYGVSKAAFAHLARVWDAELGETGVHFVAFDPGDMDTPMHRDALPDADPAALQSPATAAERLLRELDARLPVRVVQVAS